MLLKDLCEEKLWVYLTWEKDRGQDISTGMHDIECELFSVRVCNSCANVLFVTVDDQCKML